MGNFDPIALAALSKASQGGGGGGSVAPLVVNLTPTDPTNPLGGGTHNASAADLSAAWAAGRPIRASITGVADFDLALYDAGRVLYSCVFVHYIVEMPVLINAYITGSGTYGCSAFYLTAAT